MNETGKQGYNRTETVPTQAQIEAAIGRKFRTFDGGVGSEFNPIAEALKDRPLQFAAGVSVAEVVDFVLTAAAEAGKQSALTHEQVCQQKDLARYIQKIGQQVEAATIEWCSQIIDNKIAEFENEHRQWRESLGQDCAQPCEDTITVLKELAAAIRALKDKT